MARKSQHLHRRTTMGEDDTAMPLRHTHRKDEWCLARCSSNLFFCSFASYNASDLHTWISSTRINRSTKMYIEKTTPHTGCWRRLLPCRSPNPLPPTTQQLTAIFDWMGANWALLLVMDRRRERSESILAISDWFLSRIVLMVLINDDSFWSDANILDSLCTSWTLPDGRLIPVFQWHRRQSFSSIFPFFTLIVSVRFGVFFIAAIRLRLDCWPLVATFIVATFALLASVAFAYNRCWHLLLLAIITLYRCRLYSKSPFNTMLPSNPLPVADCL